MNKITESNPLSRVLFASEYRLIRHLTFVVIIATIAFNQVFIAYQNSENILGNQIYLICIAQLALYLLAIYFHYLYLTPQLLLGGRHIAYITVLFVIVITLPTLSILGEYWVRNHLNLPHRISAYSSPLILIDNLAASTITAICICGVSAGRVFREWVAGNDRVHQLEREHLQSELNKIKEQLVAPSFLSRTLRKASDATGEDPQITSCILMQLGELLRYQLYDCNRDRVLLKSEVDFLDRLLGLERLIRSDFQFEIRTEGDINKLFVAPFLFSSLVQPMMGEHTSIEVNFTFENGSLSFKCTSDGGKSLDSETLSLISQRLELKYPERHSMISGAGMAVSK